MATKVAPPANTQFEARQTAQSYLNNRLANISNTTTGTKTARPPQPFTIPIIDIGPSFSPSLADRHAVAAQIRDACTSSGFFHITGHGVPASSRAAILGLARRFFHTLPREKKEALHVRHSPYFRGWEPAEYTYVNPDDWAAGEVAAPETKEGFNWGYEAGLEAGEGDSSTNGSGGGDGRYRELDGADVNGNVWPDEADVPGFYTTLREYYSRMLGLARHLFRLFALSLDLEESHFDAMITHPGAIGRLLYYPPSMDPQPLDPDVRDKEIGLGAHSDYECFTILLSSSTSGLEILSPEDVWVAAPVVEGSFVVNIADFMMRWTNDRYKSTVHRVVNRTKEERYSVPIFFSVNYDEVVETLPSCVTEEHPVKYPPIRAGEYILERLKATAKEA